MRILGIETSCDETAAAVVENGHIILSNVINSQIDIHAVYGGVVPEVAARSHIEVINPVINQALKDANLSWDEIDAIAVTYAPGLIGSLLIGTLAARTLAILKNKPLYPIHHIEAHVYANFLNNLTPEFPTLALIVSGGHSQLMIFNDNNDYQLIGQTCDDAVGEAFDKVAKIIGLPYPGGPSIAKAALNGNPDAYILPKAHLSGPYDFSFSGLKTAVLRSVQREVGVDINFPSSGLSKLLNDAQRADFAASFQKIAIETLVDKTEKAFLKYIPKSVIIAGGVAANQELRRQLSDRLPIQINYAPIELCTDNAAMVASLGFYQSKSQSPIDPFSLEVESSLSLAK
ncbi:MAG: tRNA (adenosine(37)-N6)-threonylcarbamoyltransferase complex transferase subunit TsaD [Candidatus Saccharibacteria bacterium]